jgi:hypothetical protein
MIVKKLFAQPTDICRNESQIRVNLAFVAFCKESQSNCLNLSRTFHCDETSRVTSSLPCHRLMWRQRPTLLFGDTEGSN